MSVRKLVYLVTYVTSYTSYQQLCVLREQLGRLKTLDNQVG